MFEIIRGYKQGRAVMFYDLADSAEGKTMNMVHKDTIVKMCEKGEISNAKIQWWEGKPIVRCSNNKLPVMRLDESGNIAGYVEPVTRNHGNTPSGQTSVKREKEEVLGDISSKAVVVGKLNPKRKENIAYGGYDPKNVTEQREAKASIRYEEFETFRDLFYSMAKEYGLREIDTYAAQVSKKVELSKKVATTNRMTLLAIQNSFNTYLMNMASKEMNETFVKYRVS